MSLENVSPEIARFASDVRRALAHLPADQIAELTGDLEANVTASVADGSPIPDVDAYVAELLSAAGLGLPSPVPHNNKKTFVEAVAVLRRAVRGLEPMWWLLRAFLFVVIIGELTTNFDVSSAGTRYIAVAGSQWLGIFLLGASIVGSVWWGRSRFVLPSWAEIGLAAVLVLFGALTIRDELRVAELAASSLGYGDHGGQCAGLGYDSMGRIGLPTDPVPDLVGLTSEEADQAIVMWGRGVVMLNVTFPGPTLPMVSEDAASDMVVSRQSDPYLVAGSCPYVSIDVELDGHTSLSTTTSTIDPSMTSSTVVDATTTSLLVTETTSPLGRVPTQTTAPGTPSTIAPSPVPGVPTTTQREG
jgi:hypothetical protein